MEQPIRTNKMTHFDSSRPAMRAEPSLNASLSDRIRFAMDSDSGTEETTEGPVEQVTSTEEKEVKEAPKESGEEEEKTAPEPKKKTPEELNQDPANAVFGDEASKQKLQDFGPHTVGQPTDGELNYGIR